MKSIRITLNFQAHWIFTKMTLVLSDNDIVILIQSYEALGKSRSIQQNQVLAALQELQKWRLVCQTKTKEYLESIP